MKNLDNFKNFLVCFLSFGVRRSIDVLDPENQPGFGRIRTESGLQGSQRTSDTIVMKTNKKAFKTIEITHSILIQKIWKSLSFEVQSPRSEFCRKRIRSPAQKYQNILYTRKYYIPENITCQKITYTRKYYIPENILYK